MTQDTETKKKKVKKYHQREMLSLFGFGREVDWLAVLLLFAVAIVVVGIHTFNLFTVARNGVDATDTIETAMTKGVIDTAHIKEIQTMFQKRKDVFGSIYAGQPFQLETKEDAPTYATTSVETESTTEDESTNTDSNTDETASTTADTGTVN